MRVPAAISSSAASGPLFAIPSVTKGLFVLAVVAIGITGCTKKGSSPSGTAEHEDVGTLPPSITGKLIPAKPRKPFIGPLEIGVFAREASEVVGVDKLSIGAFHSDALYDKYRIAVRDIYGADMPDMNYFSIGHPNWQRRIPDLKHWLLRAGVYGSPTLALEPLGPNTYEVFQDSPELRKLRDMFADVKKHGVNVWIRFASEANLYQSRYSVSKYPQMLQQYKTSARWWKSYMPDNVKLVFSPLINTPYQSFIEHSPRQLEILQDMYEKGVYDRIGGTLYSTNYNVFDMYDWYTGFMRKLDPTTPMQICELGGPLSHKTELVSFIKAAVKGRWSGLEKINLFAGQVNSRAQNANGRFGFVEPGKSESYIREIFFPSS